MDAFLGWYAERFLNINPSKDKIKTDATLKMMLVGITFYGMSTFEGPLLSIRAISALAHNTDWIVGHVHSGTLSWVGFMSAAAFYYLVPRMWNTNLYSEKISKRSLLVRDSRHSTLHCFYVGIWYH